MPLVISRDPSPLDYSIKNDRQLIGSTSKHARNHSNKCKVVLFLLKARTMSLLLGHCTVYHPKRLFLAQQSSFKLSPFIACTPFPFLTMSARRISRCFTSCSQSPQQGTATMNVKQVLHQKYETSFS